MSDTLAADILRALDGETSQTDGFYEGRDSRGQEWLFGWDEDVTGIFGWRLPLDETATAEKSFGDDESEAAPLIADFLAAPARAHPDGEGTTHG